MQYYGNLALREERKKADPAPRRQPNQAPRKNRRSIPVGEKLLYLLTVMVLVAVACLVVYRYAALYQLNREIQTTSSQYDKAVEESKELQREIIGLRDPDVIQKKALALGLVPLDEQPITLSPSGGRTATASKP